MSRAYYQQTDGEWVEPPMEGWRVACCDCGLVHVLDFRVTPEGAVQVRASRHPRATAAKRRMPREFVRKIG